MPRHRTIDGRIAAIAARQHGVFTFAQAIRAGATHRMVDHRVVTGRWDRVHRGVFRPAGHPESFEASVMAACFAVGPDAVVSHAASGALWRLDGLECRTTELSVPRRVRIREICAHEVHDLGRFDITRLGVIPVTSPARTLIDLAGDLDRPLLETALDDALRRGIVTLPRLRSTYGRLAHRGRSGVAVVRELLEARPSLTAVPDSPLEARMLRLLRQARLPAPVLHHRVTDRGRTIAVIDLAYPDLLIAIELDGYRYHHGRQRWQSDLTRMNALTTRGWRVLRFSYQDVEERPDAVVGSVSSALGTNNRHWST